MAECTGATKLPCASTDILHLEKQASMGIGSEVMLDNTQKRDSGQEASSEIQ